MTKYSSIDEADASSSSPATKQGSLRVKAKHTELPAPQSPRKINVKVVTKTRTNKSYAQNAAEIVPLRSGTATLEHEEEDAV